MPEDPREAGLIAALAPIFDAAWYQARYPEIAATGMPPIRHFIRAGLIELRDPNRFFDSLWYADHYPDVMPSGLHPLLHYLQIGAGELRDPHPRFDARFYTAEHREAAGNPLLFHLHTGAARGYPTEPPIRIADYLPAETGGFTAPAELRMDVIIPVYRGLVETQRCISSVLRDPTPTRVIVIDDRSPEAALVVWLDRLAALGRIVLIRNRRNLGFVASVNLGMAAAGDHDVVLLNSDTEVPAGWLTRLAAQAYAAPTIATVSPFSNNATICGYPGDHQAPLAFGAELAEIDAACQTANAGRFVILPTTVGFCMYIRRAALDAVGPFDAARFGAGYGEENDFCLRASAFGWQHRLACDVFVFHQGGVSFGARTRRLQARAMALLVARFADYPTIVARHVALGAANPFRFAVTVALLRQSARPVILLVSHNMGGGVEQHVAALIDRLADRTNVLLLSATDRGAALSVPFLPDHPILELPADRRDDLARLLRAMKVGFVHVHSVAGMDLDVGALIRDLGVKFDTTLHDYFALCPQVFLLPAPDRAYCDEPGIGTCNGCIAARPSFGARDIVTWRAKHAWMLRDADRVLCPSQDAVARLERFGLADRAVLAPHEPVAAGPWPLAQLPARRKLRVAVLGALADHKGANLVGAVAATADPRCIEIILIGYLAPALPPLAEVRVTGRYDNADLPGLIARHAPDLIWFPASWPETYSFTLSAAIASGRPIMAPRIGAFPERLAGRPRSWLVPATIDAATCLAQFETIRAELRAPSEIVARPAIADFYVADYWRPTRRPHARPKVAIIPECFDNGTPTPCGYIRLVQPFDHEFRGAVAIGADCDADIIVTQRHALADLDAARALVARARRIGARLVYDLDDDLLNIPPNHPEALLLRPKAAMVRYMLENADAVWVATEGLKARVAAVRPDVVVIPNRLDERLWAPAAPKRDAGPVRILCMGTTTHVADFALIAPALDQVKREFGDAVSIDVLGMTNAELPDGVTRILPSAQGGRSYPGFVHWLTRQAPGWDIGLAPLLETPFNLAKSPIKVLDYAALGLAILASDMPVYRGSLAERLVANDGPAWLAALLDLILDPVARRAMAGRAQTAFLAQASLAAQGRIRHDALSAKVIFTRI